MNTIILWLIIAVSLIIIELLTTTLYLLFLALVALSIALLAWLGINFMMQIILASIIGIFGILIIYKFKLNHKLNNIKKNKTNNLDIGQTVKVILWQQEYTDVIYKGANWQAKYIGSLPIATLNSGEYIIFDTQANLLLLKEKNNI